MKKLASLLLSLLLCLSLLPGQARAADTAEGAPPVQTEVSEAAQLDEPDGAAMPLGEDFHIEEGTARSED